MSTEEKTMGHRDPNQMEERQMQNRLNEELERSRRRPGLGTTWVASRVREEDTDRTDPVSVLVGFFREMQHSKWKRATRYARPQDYDRLLASVKLKPELAEGWGRAQRLVVHETSNTHTVVFAPEIEIAVHLIYDQNKWWVERWDAAKREDSKLPDSKMADSKMADSKMADPNLADSSPSDLTDT